MAERDMHEGAGAANMGEMQQHLDGGGEDSDHNGQDIEFLHNVIGNLTASITMAQNHLAAGQHSDVASLASDLLSMHAPQLATALNLSRQLGPASSVASTGGSSSGGHASAVSGTTGGAGGAGSAGGGGRALAFGTHYYEQRAALTAAAIDSLPDSVFAYIESGGTKDAQGKTVPRSKRHFPIHDKAHVQNALARAPQSPFGKQAMPKILVAAKKFGIEVSQSNSREPGGFAYRMMPFDVRSAGGDGLTLEGYAAVFNSPTSISSWEGDFDETIAPGAFKRSLAERTPVLMFEHGKHPLIGSMPLGVIKRTSEDSKGLHIEARLSDNWLIQPVRDAVRDGAVNGMSFRFSVPKGGDTWTERKNNTDLRTINEAKVTELGPVVFPAYEPTTAQVRSLVEHFDLTGQSTTRSLDGSDLDARLRSGAASTPQHSTAGGRDRYLALAMRGILNA